LKKREGSVRGGGTTNLLLLEKGKASSRKEIVEALGVRR